MRCSRPVRAALGPARQERASPALQVPAAPESRAVAPPAALQRVAPVDSSRRQLLGAAALLAAAAVGPSPSGASVEGFPIPMLATVSGYTPMPSLKGKDYGKPRTIYSDYVSTPSGLQFVDIVEGTGAEAQQGKTVVVDWSGVTIGYYGRPFEARNKAKGGAFAGDEKEFFRFVVGSHSVIPGFEEAVTGMRVGGIRRVIVPEELGYPGSFDTLGPVPTTFSGKRTLDFVLKNRGMIDKTILFDIELLKVV